MARGFLVTNFILSDEKLLNQERILLDGYVIQRESPQKFCKDRIFKYDAQVAIITEGVVLNKKSILKKYEGG